MKHRLVVLIFAAALVMAFGHNGFCYELEVSSVGGILRALNEPQVDTITVMDGEYVFYETVYFPERPVILRSKNGPEKTTLIFGQDVQHPALPMFIRIEQGPYMRSKIQGFTIKTGTEAGSPFARYAIWTYSSTDISGNIFPHGGGIVLLRNVYDTSGPWPSVHHNVITQDEGGGLRDVVIASHNVNSNIFNNTITGTETSGAVIGVMSNNEHNIPVTIVNNIIYGNSALEPPIGDWAPIKVYENDSVLPTVIYNDIQGGYEGEGNIDVDPEFYLPLLSSPRLRDYRLRLTSPCIGTGGPPDAGMSRPNMGALEPIPLLAEMYCSQTLLTWDWKDHIVRYIVQRAQHPGGDFYTIGYAIDGNGFFEDPDIVRGPNTFYRYRLVGIPRNGIEEWSEAMLAIPRADLNLNGEVGVDDFEILKQALREYNERADFDRDQDIDVIDVAIWVGWLDWIFPTDIGTAAPARSPAETALEKDSSDVGNTVGEKRAPFRRRVRRRRKARRR
ncbi:hypothetical protein ACFL1E_07765 [Candidatus Omnitrophota bacterium]